MQDNQLDNLLKEKLQGKIMASPEMENRIKAKIEEQKRLAKKENDKKHKKYYFMKPLLSVAAIAVIAFTFGISLKNNNIEEIFKAETQVSVIKSIEPTKLQSGIIANDTEFIIQADENSDKESVQRSIYVEPAIDYTIEKTGNANEYKLKFKQNIPDNTIVKLEYVKDKITQNSWAYQTSDKLSITSTFPSKNDGNIVTPNTTIAIEFSYANIENFEENVSIYPNVDGEWKQYGRVWRFTPTSEFEEKEYTVTIKGGITAGKEKLENDYIFNFMVRNDENPTDKIINKEYTADGINTYKPDENVKIYYYFENYYNDVRAFDISKVKISKFKDEEDFINYLESKNPEKSLNTKEYEFQINTKDEYIELNSSLPTGYYVASVQNSSEKELFNCPIQINSINAYAMETERDVLVWVADDNGLAKNIKVEYAGKEQKTDSDGIAKFEEIADGSEKIKYAKVGNNEGKLVVGFYNYKFDNYPSAYLYTDRLIYKNTDTIKIWGFIPKILFHGEIEDEFYLKLNDEEKTKIEINEDGTFCNEIKLQNQLDEEDCVIGLYYKDEYITSRLISIKNYELQNYEYEFIADKNYAFVGTTYEFDVKVKHITGLVVPNKEVAIKYEEEIFYATTSENGCAHFSLNIVDDESNYSTINPKSIAIFNGSDVEYTTAEEYIDFYVLTSDIEIKARRNAKDVYEIELYKLLLDKNIDVFYDLECFRNDVYNTEIKVNLIENSYQRNIVDYSYNEYTQEMEPQYEYYDFENITNITTITTENGIAKFDASNIELKKNTEDTNYNYQLEFEFKDPKGRTIKEVDYYFEKIKHDQIQGIGYYYDDYLDNVYDELYEIPQNIDQNYYYVYRYFLGRAVDDFFSIGDTQKFTLYESIENGKKEIQNKGEILRIVFKDNISKTEIIKDNNFDYTFTKEDFPECKITTAYYYNGKFYRMPIYYFDFKEKDRKLDIEIKTDKEKYNPGEEVSVTVKTTTNNKPIKTCVNISVVNEAAFALEGDTTDILEKIYTNKTFPIYTYSTYRDCVNSSLEGGGGERWQRWSKRNVCRYCTF